jgi:hypothetical protein
MEQPKAAVTMLPKADAEGEACRDVSCVGAAYAALPWLPRQQNANRPRCDELLSGSNDDHPDWRAGRSEVAVGVRLPVQPPIELDTQESEPRADALAHAYLVGARELKNDPGGRNDLLVIGL